MLTAILVAFLRLPGTWKQAGNLTPFPNCQRSGTISLIKIDVSITRQGWRRQVTEKGSVQWFYPALLRMLG